MTEDNFTKAQSNNLPRVDSLMVAEFFSSSSEFTLAEIRGIKAQRAERQNYGGAAIGYVQLKRSGGVCVIKCKICPEHRIHAKTYNVMLEIDENNEKIIKGECQDCAASAGGCKHVVAFIMWVHRRSEEPAPTDVQCYWKKSKLAGVGTSFKYTTIKDFGSVRINQSSNNVNNFLEQFLEKGREAKAPCQVLKHLNEDNTNLNQLGLHEIICDFLQAKHVPNFDNFVQFAADKMTLSACKEAFLVTGDQSELRLWHNLRYGKITASKLYDVSRCKTASGSLVENIIGTMKIRETSAMKRGKDLEKKVISILGKKVNIKFKRCGIMLSPKYPILGASPDAISDDFVVEIKCPSSERTVTSFITADGQVPNKHKAQIMLQMLLLEKYKGIFCVADPSFEENLEIKYVFIDFDKNFIEDVIKNSISFWKENIFPILIN